MRRVAAIGLLVPGMTQSAAASAAELPGARLTVSRNAGAETCPDADALALELSPRVTAGNTPEVPLDLSVEVARDGDAFVAAIHVEGRRHGERLLRAEGPACDALHDALVVTLLVLLDEERAAAASATTPGAATIPTTPATTAAPVAPRAPRPEASEEPAAPAPLPAETSPLLPSLWLSAGGGVSYGIPYKWSGILLFDLALRFGPLEFSGGAFWAPTRTISAPPGHVSVSAWPGERLRGCYAFSPQHTRGTRFLGCAQGIHTTLTGEASTDFEGAHSATRDWWLAGGSLEATYPLSARIDVGISLSALATLNPETFSIKGLSTKPFETHSVGIAAARLEARLF
jgi:hypothetical protein